METAIPIRNLYYLLCYAWDRLEERDLIPADAVETPRDAVNLLASVLASGTKALIRRGFERGYSDRTDEIGGIRGRLVLGDTVRRNLPRYGRAVCEFDELEHDTPANRVIRGTLSVLVRSAEMEESLRREMAALLRHFRDVTEVRVTERDCRRVVIHRNNRHYGFLIDLCAFILARLLPDESGSGRVVRDFTRDHQAMARLFEDFVRNFYRHHAAECGIESVTSKAIPWKGQPENEQSARHWPKMQSDICLYRPRAPLVVDCKFYHAVLKENQHGTETLSSANLYQVFTYAQNLAAVPGWENVEGLLLYAENGRQLDIAHTTCGRRFRAATVKLDAPWPEIHQRLISVVWSSTPLSNEVSV